MLLKTGSQLYIAGLTVRPNIRQLILLICILTLSGCVPYAPISYYEPDAGGRGRLVTATCPPGEKFLRLYVSGVKVGVRAEEWRISMTFEIPEGKEVRLLSDAIEVVRASGKRKQLRIEGGDFTLGETMHGAKRRRFKDPVPYSGISNKIYWLGVQFEESLGYGLDLDNAVIHFPPFEIDGKQKSLPEITITKVKKGVWFYPLNC